MLLKKVIVLLLSLSLSLSVLAGVQDDRKALIQKLIGAEVFQKVEVPGFLPHLWVSHAFYGLSFDSKNSFVNVVYSYYYTQNPDFDLIVLYDSRSGKKIGTFSATYGGLDLH
jgi:hypothetical protein